MNKTIFRKILEKLLGYIFIGLSTVLPKKNIYLFAGQHGKESSTIQNTYLITL